MASYVRTLPMLFSLCFLLACNPDKNSDLASKNSELTAVETLSQETSDGSDEIIINTDDNCGSLKSLLRLLPQSSQMDGLSEIYRGCENASEQTVSVIYANDMSASESNEHTEYEFKIYVLDSASTYAKANLTVEGATTEQQSFINKTFTTTGDMRKTVLDICKRYHLDPMIPDGRNPLIVKVQDLDVCVMDNLDANKEIWNSFTMKDGLEFRLELRGHKAAGIAATEAAGDHLIPLFEKFALDVIVDAK